MTSIGSSWDLASDAELITAVRSGDTTAFGALYERHVAAARAVARQYSNSPADAEDAVSDAFSRVFAAIRQGGGPDVTFRAYLFTVLRRVALHRVETGRRAEPTDDLETFEVAVGPASSTEEPALESFERGMVSGAYRSLPERWQAVLWYTEVEGLSPAEIAPVLGLTANGVAALAYRAREGLRQAYLQQHLAAPADEGCTIVNGKLGAYVRGGLAKRETALVELHLDDCARCRALVLELGDVNHGMRVVVAPLVLGAVAYTVLQGVGFGGSAATAVTGAAATAGASGAAGTGTGSGTAGAGTGAGTAGGSGATVGSSTAAGSSVASGTGSLVGAGAGTGSVATGAVASGGAAVAGLSTAASAAAVPVAAGAAVGASAAGATGLAALIAAVPLGGIGLAAAGVVVAAVVGVAGVTGVFSGGEDAPADQAVAQEEPVDGGAGGSVDEDPGDLEPAPEAPSTTPEPAPAPQETVPADVDGDASGTTGSTSDDSRTVGDTDPATADEPDPADPVDPDPTDPDPTDPDPVDPDPTDPDPVDPDPTDPGPTDPDPTDPDPVDPDPVDPDPTDPDPTDPEPGPAVLALAPLPGVDLVSGVPTTIAVTVSNTGGSSATDVHTAFAFPEGTTGTVTAVDPLVDAGAGATRLRFAATGWSCTAGPTTEADCVLDVLPPGTSTTLHAAVVVTDESLDGATDVGLAISTWMRGAEDRRVTSSVPGRLGSQPAQLVTSWVTAPGELVGPVDATATSDRAVLEVRNTGGTTLAAGTPVRLSVADLPGAVRLVPTGGTCAVDGADVVCELPSLARRGGVTELAVDVVVDPTLPDDTSRALGAVRATVPPGLEGGLPAEAPVAVRSAPGELATSAPVTLDLARGEAGALPVTVRNTGRTTVADVTVTLQLPAAVTFADGEGRCSAGGGAGALVTCAIGSIAPGGVVVLEPWVVAQGLGADGRAVTVSVAGGDLQASATTTLRVTEPLPACAPAWSWGFYAPGTVVSYDRSNWQRQDTVLPSIYAPGSPGARWTWLSECR